MCGAVEDKTVHLATLKENVSKRKRTIQEKQQEKEACKKKIKMADNRIEELEAKVAELNQTIAEDEVQKTAKDQSILSAKEKGYQSNLSLLCSPSCRFPPPALPFPPCAQGFNSHNALLGSEAAALHVA